MLRVCREYGKFVLPAKDKFFKYVKEADCIVQNIL